MSQVLICNRALGWLGASKITSVDDASVSAELCKDNWDSARDVVLEAREWTWAVERVQLAADATAPAWGYGVRYQVPSDCLRVLQAGDGLLESNVEWVREGQYILTKQTAPLYLRYLRRVEDTALWSPGFTQAMALQLAAQLSIALTENESQFERLIKLYEMTLRKAGALDGMQGRSERRRVSAISARRW